MKKMQKREEFLC